VAKDAGKLGLMDLSSYAVGNFDLLGEPHHYMGGWHDPQSGKVFLDVSIHVNSAQEAEALCKKHDQIAYFDLNRGKSVTVDPNATSGGAKSADQGDNKPRLGLVSGKPALADLEALFVHLTGRQPTAQEKEAAQVILDSKK
jgi:hypothetical protein